MSFSAFGILLLIGILVFLVAFSGRGLRFVFTRFFVFSAISSLILDVGYVAKIGSFTLEFNYVFSVISLLLAICCLIMYRIDLNRFALPIVFLVFIAGVAFSGLLLGRTYTSVGFNDEWDPYFASNTPLPAVGVTTHSFFLIARTAIFLFDFTVFASLSKRGDIRYILKAMRNLSFVVLALSLIELLVSNAAGPTLFRSWVMGFFGESESTYLFARPSFGGIYTPMLFMREPSSYCYALFILSLGNIAIYYSSCARRERTTSLITVLLFAVILVLSSSMSALLYLLTLYLALVVMSKRRIQLLLGSLVVVVVLGGVVIGLYSRRLTAAFETLSSFAYLDPSHLPASSEIMRLYSVYNNLSLFLSHPFFGCGIGTVFSYSSIATMLSNLGLVGTVMFVFCMKNTTNYFFRVNKFSVLSLVIIVVSHMLTGHMSFLLYLDRVAVLYLIGKHLSLVGMKKNTYEYKKTMARALAGGLVYE